MSRKNRELVMGLQPPPEADVAQLMRDENFSAASSSVLSPFFHPDFECTLPRFNSTKTYTGMDGLRALWLDWLAPWATYRSEIEDAIDLADRVLVLVHDFGCREGSAQQVEQRSGAVWAVRDGKVAHAAFYPTRADALKAVGLEEWEMSRENVEVVRLALEESRREERGGSSRILALGRGVLAAAISD